MVNHNRQAVLLGLSAVALWSTVATAFKLSLHYLSPLALVTLASLTSWLFFLLIISATGRWATVLTTTKRDLGVTLAIGVLNPALYYFLLFGAYARLPAQEAMALNYTWALTLPLLAAPLLKQRLTGKESLAALVSYAGVFIIATRGEPWTFTLADPAGVALAVGSTIIWALCWIANTRHNLEPVVALFFNFTASTPILLFLSSMRGELSPLPVEGLLGGLYIGLFEMGISFICWLSAMRLTQSTARISTLIFLSPPVSLILIWLVLGEPVQGYTVGGLGLILGGLALQHRL